MLDDMRNRKIDMADEIFVINVGGYIGSSTKSEIEYAQTSGKKVNYLEWPGRKNRGEINMGFNPGQQVVYEYDNRSGIITGLRRGERWQVKFSDGENMYIPESKLIAIGEEDMFSDFSAGRFQGIDDLKRIMYKYRLSGELTNILYSMSNRATRFMPHQFIPVTKFLESYTDRLLIADEVGLGKTIESMYIWEEVRARRNAKRLLIVVPAILRFKWKMDLRQYFGIDAHIVSAQNSDNASSLLDYIQDTIMLPQKENFELIVSLEGLRTAERVKELLRQNRDIRRIFDLVIIDEAHYLRNSNTRSFETGELLRDVSESFLLLSATPIQTGSDNFYNLLRLLSDEEFHNKSNFEMQLMENYPLVKLASAIDENDDLKTVKALLQATLASASYKKDSDILQLAQTIDAVMASTARRIETVAKIRGKYFYDGFVTRTRKRDVIENRTERKAAAINYPLSPVEREFYEQVTSYLKSKGDRENVFNNFSLITRQRQMASCMPAALENWRASGKGELSHEEDDSVFADLDEKNGSPFRSVTMPYFENIELSALIANDTKFHRVLRMIQSIMRDNPTEKIVIFSFFRGTVEYLYRHLSRAGIRCSLIMGGLKDNEKTERLMDFRDKNINVLVSTEVGSEGIDLQFAKYEINYDLPWNPMRLEQRIGRLDRIGQESPTIYIFNAFCRDTIEDRILSRLYDRIQTFKDSIGDLEEILGEVIQSLELDVFLNHYETEEDVTRKAQQVEQAIINKQMINKDLEIKSGMFSVYQEFILNNIKTAHDNFRRITAEELMFTVQDFINSRFPGSTMEYTKKPDSAIVRLSPQAADGLSNYIKASERQSNTTLCNARQGTLCCFSNRGERGGESKLYREIVDINHPFVKWIVHTLKSENAFSSSCSAVQVSRKILPEALRIPAGIYTFYIQQWAADGARKLNELHYFVNSIGNSMELSPGAAESLLTATILHGDSFDMNMVADDDLDQAVNAVNQLIDGAWRHFEAFETAHRTQNNDMIHNQEQYLRRTTQKKIEGYHAIIDELRMKNNNDRVIRMWEGRINHATEDMEVKLRRLNSKFNCPITCGDVAVGILMIKE